MFAVSITSSFNGVVSIEFCPLGTVELTTNWYQLHNGENGYMNTALVII